MSDVIKGLRNLKRHFGLGFSAFDSMAEALMSEAIQRLESSQKELETANKRLSEQEVELVKLRKLVSQYGELSQDSVELDCIGVDHNEKGFSSGKLDCSETTGVILPDGSNIPI